MTNNWRDKYDYVGDFYNGFAPVKLDDKWVFVDQRLKAARTKTRS
jgi:hypothetical protein